LNPSEPCFVLTALLGFPLRSFRRPPGHTAFPRYLTHLPFLRRFTHRPEPTCGRGGRGFWAFSLATNLVSSGAKGAPETSCSLGVLLSRVYCRLTLSSPSGTLLSCASVERDMVVCSIAFPCALQSLNRPSAGNSSRCRNSAVSTLLRFVHLSVPDHLDLSTPGYAFTSPGLDIAALDARS
jgi:hypothetical protein